MEDNRLIWKFQLLADHVFAGMLSSRWLWVRAHCSCGWVTGRCLKQEKAMISLFRHQAAAGLARKAP